MNVLEKEIEDMICQGLAGDRPLLRKKGLWIWEDAAYQRQVDFGSYGICDILGMQVYPRMNGTRYINAHIIEIKKEEVNIATFLQAARYAKAVQRIIKKRLTNTKVQCAITLIGKTVDSSSDFIYLPDIIDNLAIYTYKLDFKDGITFQREAGYCITNEVLPDNECLTLSVVSSVSQKIKLGLEDHPF